MLQFQIVQSQSNSINISAVAKQYRQFRFQRLSYLKAKGSLLAGLNKKSQRVAMKRGCAE